MFGFPRACRLHWRILLAGMMVSAVAVMPVSTQAQPVGARGAFFVPSSAWLVGEAFSPGSGSAGGGASCVMMNTYDNGFVVRFSGSESGLIAMAVDFRQDVFTRGQNYPVAVSFPSGTVKQFQAAAYDSGTLVFDLRKDSDFNRLVQGEERMHLALGPVMAGLSLEGVNDGLSRLRECAGKPDSRTAMDPLPVPPEPVALAAANTEPVRVTADISWDRPSRAKIDRPEVTEQQVRQTPPPAPPAPAERSSEVLTPVPPSVSAVADVMPQQPQTRMATAIPAPVSSMPVDASGSGNAFASEAPIQSHPIVWHAREGEDIKKVLMQWSEIAGYDFVWESDRSGTVQDAFRFEGTFEEAVAQLLSESGKAAGIQGQIAGKASAPAVIPSGQAYASVSASAPPQAQESWQAIRGTDMRTVLQLWARQAGVELLWDSPVDFPVKQTVNLHGNFESALQMVLEQYNQEPLRPVGRLHNPRGTAQKFLIIEAMRPS